MNVYKKVKISGKATGTKLGQKLGEVGCRLNVCRAVLSASRGYQPCHLGLTRALVRLSSQTALVFDWTTTLSYGSFLTGKSAGGRFLGPLDAPT